MQRCSARGSAANVEALQGLLHGYSRPGHCKSLQGVQLSCVSKGFLRVCSILQGVRNKLHMVSVGFSRTGAPETLDVHLSCVSQVVSEGLQEFARRLQQVAQGFRPGLGSVANARHAFELCFQLVYAGLQNSARCSQQVPQGFQESIVGAPETLDKHSSCVFKGFRGGGCKILQSVCNRLH